MTAELLHSVSGIGIGATSQFILASGDRSVILGRDGRNRLARVRP
jgi:hypothetical protein